MFILGNVGQIWAERGKLFDWPKSDVLFLKIISKIKDNLFENSRRGKLLDHSISVFFLDSDSSFMVSDTGTMRVSGAGGQNLGRSRFGGKIIAIVGLMDLERPLSDLLQYCLILSKNGVTRPIEINL